MELGIYIYGTWPEENGARKDLTRAGFDVDIICLGHAW